MCQGQSAHVGNLHSRLTEISEQKGLWGGSIELWIVDKETGLWGKLENVIKHCASSQGRRHCVKVTFPYTEWADSCALRNLQQSSPEKWRDVSEVHSNGSGDTYKHRWEWWMGKIQTTGESVSGVEAVCSVLETFPKYKVT